MDKKGQIFTIDLLISLFIFLLLFTTVLLFLYSNVDINNSYSSYYSQITSNYINNVAVQGANSLLGSEGYPPDWYNFSCNQIKLLGVMHNNLEVSPLKLYGLTALSTSCISSLLKAGNSFNITFYYLNGSILTLNGKAITIGFPVDYSSSYVASIQRFTVLYPGNQIIRLSYTEWS
jgi:succinate dehydrogenase/fumarate reductase cytochrome b subunit